MATFRRQDELESRLIEEETAKRVEEELAKRVQQLLFERKDEIEAEVLRRVEEAKKVGLVWWGCGLWVESILSSVLSIWN